MKKNEIRVYFRLTEFDCDPEELTSLIGVDPTETWRIGDIVDKRSTVRMKVNGWSLHSGLGKSSNIEEQIEALLTILSPVRSKLLELRPTLYAEFACFVYAYESVPEIHFDRTTLSKVAELGAGIDVDLYCLIGVEHKSK